MEVKDENQKGLPQEENKKKKTVSRKRAEKKTEIVEKAELAPVDVHVSDPSTPTMALVERAITSGVDVDALEKILDLDRRAREEVAAGRFSERMMQFQKEMPMVLKTVDGPSGHWQYAPYEHIWKIARPILTELGFEVSFEQEDTENELTVTCVVTCCGHTRRTPYTLPKDPPIANRSGRAVTTQAQAQASSNSQAKRHAFCNAFNIVCAGEDTDGGDPRNHARIAASPYISDEQVQEMQVYIDQCEDLDVDAFLAYLNVKSLKEVTPARYPFVVKKLRKRMADGPPKKKEEATEEESQPSMRTGEVKAHIVEVEETSGESKGKAWTRYKISCRGIDGETFITSTFSKTQGTIAQEYADSGEVAGLNLKDDEFGSLIEIK